MSEALDPKTAPTFPMAAHALLGDAQLRKNVRHATNVIPVSYTHLDVYKRQIWARAMGRAGF